MVNARNPSDDPRARYLVSFRAGDVIVREGDAGKDMFILEDGEVEIFRHHGGAEKVLSRLEAGDFFGEMSVLEGRPRSSSARAANDCRLLPIDASTLDALLREHPEIAVRMLRKLSNRVRKYEDEEAAAAIAARGALPDRGRTDLAHMEAAAVAPEGTHAAIAAAPAPAAPAVAAPALPSVVPSPVATPAAAGGVLARLEIPASGHVFPIVADRPSFVGRFDPVTETSPEIDLGAADTQRSTSRRHARITPRDGRFFLFEEVGTANGTWVGAERLPNGVEHELADGATIRFGRVDCVFRVGAG
jgi:hypothetical protein